MSTRYLEINSSYRNREEYPNQSTFEVINGNYTESFPQLTSFPVYTFEPNAYGTEQATFAPSPGETLFLTTSRYRPSLDLNGWPYNIYETKPTYQSYHMYVYENSVSSPNLIDSRTIQQYNPSSSTFTLNSPLSIVPVPDPSVTPHNTSYLLDITPFSQIDDPDNFATYQGPEIYFNIQNPSNVYNQKPVLTATTYVGYYLMNDSNYGTPNGEIITSLNPDTLIVTIQNPLSSLVITDKASLIQRRQFSIRKTLPVVRGQLLTIDPSRNVVTLDAYASSVNDAYKGMYLYVEPSFGDPDFPNFAVNKNTFGLYLFKILRYDGTTKKAYLEGIINPGIIGSGAYEIMNNRESSWNPLIYTGSSVVRPDPICMTVGLTALILPNVLLNTGARIAFYPFVYVELRNATSSKTVGKDIIYSNNPNAHSAIFVVPITDIRNPSRAPFIKLKAKMKQTIKFKPNDNFIFRVYLPDGTPFQTQEADNIPPLPPNPLLQIEAVFNYTPV